ncbi:MAG TPA: o-succinylbenzoate--CoA ligase [Rubrobacteraceae bacterium]|nr:o-succinylbenzoate--CoA ligase [Rubrobacteraceae bacterium]
MSPRYDALQAPCPLRAAALAAPDAPAILGSAGGISYAELDRRVSGTAENLTENGCAPGMRVALYLEKDERYLVLLLALLRAGCVVCPVSTRVPAEGVVALLGTATCSALISAGDFHPADGASLTVLRPDSFLQEASEAAVLEPLDIPLNRPATIIFTSGSTGTPKAALHTFGNHYYSALGSGANIPLASDDRWLHSLPLYHVGGLSIVFRCLLSGAAMAMPEAGIPLGEAIARSGATHVSLVATQLRRLLAQNHSSETLKAVLMGGGPVPDTLVDEALDRGLPVHTSYGLTEMASQVTTTPPDASRAARHTSGRVLPHREVSVAEDGEILVRGDTLFAGYVEGDVVDPRLDAEGWFHTKDLGELDADGYLRVTGRRDNQFVSGGENVQPEEIEAALCKVRGVEEAVVVPVPDEEFGERPVAFVRAPTGLPEDLAKALEPVLPRFKIPAVFHEWPEFSGPEGMKPDRAAFRKLAQRGKGTGAVP